MLSGRLYFTTYLSGISPAFPEVTIEALPNEKGFIDLGHRTLEHTPKGFYLTVSETKESLSFSSGTMTSVQTEYDYKVKGESIVLSTKDCCSNIER